MLGLWGQMFALWGLMFALWGSCHMLLSCKDMTDDYVYILTLLIKDQFYVDFFLSFVIKDQFYVDFFCHL